MRSPARYKGRKAVAGLASNCQNLFTVSYGWVPAKFLGNGRSVAHFSSSESCKASGPIEGKLKWKPRRERGSTKFEGKKKDLADLEYQRPRIGPRGVRQSF